MARPTKLTSELRDQIVAGVVAGATVEAAVQACGIGLTTHYDWRRRHSGYRVAVDDARATARRRRQESAWRRSALFLEREYPERWGAP